MKNSTKYQQGFATLSAAGVGVVLTRTREPFRSIDALKEWAFTKNLPFGIWNVCHGWSIHRPTDDPDRKVTPDKMTDPFAALKRISDVDGNGQNAWTSGVYVMHAVHPWLEKHPGLIECLRHYVREFAEKTKLRLVLVVPEIFNLPDELSHDIPILDYDLPNREELHDILDYVVESSTPQGTDVPDMFTIPQKETVVGSAGGMTQMEAEVAYAKAIVENRPQWPAIPFDLFNGSVLAAKTEVVKSSEVLELMDSVSLDEIGGLDVLKEWITTASSSFTKEARDFGVDVPKGFCAIGPPGTGKSLVGKVVGTVLGQPVIKFDVSRCFAGIVGQSEGRVRSALKQLDAMAPCVAFLDEIDKGLGGAHQNGGDSGVSRRVLGAILTHMQESKAPIFWIFTANRHEPLDPALLRKGRMDEVFAVLPPNMVERRAVFEIHLRKRKQDPSRISDLEVAVRASKGYVSAELEASVKEAVKIAFHTKTKVTGALIAEQLRNMKPLSEAFPEDFAAMEHWAQNNARLSSSPSPEEEGPSFDGVAARPRKRRAMMENS